MAKAPLLDVRDLRVHFKVYGGVLRVLDGVNLTVHSGERVGLVGETGCGKTTTMKSILRILPMPPGQIVGGEIYHHGRDVLKLPQRELRQVRGGGISMIFQDPTAALNPVFSIGAQLEAVIKHSQDGRRLSKRDVRERSLSVLHEVALADPERLLDSYPVQLSGGMRQRVCIAMALVANPELLIADEPGTSLDVTIQDQILRLLDNLVEERDTSIILITHTLGVVREMTDRVYVMYAGNIVESAPTAELFANPSHPYTQALMETIPRLTGGGIAEGIPGRIPDYRDPPAGCRFHTRCPFVMGVCKREKPPNYRVGPNHKAACFLYDEDVEAVEAGVPDGAAQ